MWWQFDNYWEVNLTTSVDVKTTVEREIIPGELRSKGRPNPNARVTKQDLGKQILFQEQFNGISSILR